ncbi:hypothetical protein CFL29_005065 [Salmonella enterica]|nr:hypothetical protein [Salmonella enterica]EAV1935759.1 hypothetical protein [Salmonella enterica]EDQ7909755.1 hypothetical protein [Salmonella enterica]EKS0039536.1 hypothetical protein [Salmonella enterica]
MKSIGQTLLILGCICMGLTIIGWMNDSGPTLFIIVPLLSGGFCVLIGSAFTVGGAIIDELRAQRKD